MAENSFGETPLHFACSNGHLEITKYLIKSASCSPICGDARGSTHFIMPEWSPRNCQVSDQ